MYNFLTLIMTNPSKKYRLNVQKKQTKIKSKEKEKYWKQLQQTWHGLIFMVFKQIYF